MAVKAQKYQQATQTHKQTVGEMITNTDQLYYDITILLITRDCPCSEKGIITLDSFKKWTAQKFSTFRETDVKTFMDLSTKDKTIRRNKQGFTILKTCKGENIEQHFKSLWEKRIGSESSRSECVTALSKAQSKAKLLETSDGIPQNTHTALKAKQTVVDNAMSQSPDASASSTQHASQSDELTMEESDNSDSDDSKKQTSQSTQEPSTQESDNMQSVRRRTPKRGSNSSHKMGEHSNAITMTNSSSTSPKATQAKDDSRVTKASLVEKEKKKTEKQIALEAQLKAQRQMVENEKVRVAEAKKMAMQQQRKKTEAENAKRKRKEDAAQRCYLHIAS